MEPETIQKNGASPKSLIMSRRNHKNKYNMKKLFVAAVIAMFVFGFASCKSECECTVGGVTTSSGKISKSDCKDVEKKANEAGMGIVTTKCVSK